MSEVMEKDIREIKWKVDGVEKSVDLLVRANRKEITADLMDFFGRSKDRVKVFLEVDGKKTVKQIWQKLGMQQENVSKRITELVDEGLIKLKRTSRTGKVYDKTEKVKILDLEKLLRKKFHLGERKDELSPAVTSSGESPEK